MITLDRYLPPAKFKFNLTKCLDIIESQKLQRITLVAMLTRGRIDRRTDIELKVKTTPLFRPLFASPKWCFHYDFILDIKTTQSTSHIKVP